MVKTNKETAVPVSPEQMYWEYEIRARYCGKSVFKPQADAPDSLQNKIDRIDMGIGLCSAETYRYMAHDDRGIQ